MTRTGLCFLLIFLVTFQALVADAQQNVTCSKSGGQCINKPHAFACNSTDPPMCVCNINYEESGTDCALKACSNGTSVPTTVCGANTSCTKDTSKCSCLANFETVAATPDRCTQIECDGGTASKCRDADANSYCDGSNCACKTNFNGTARANCERIPCSNDMVCSETNSVCHTGVDAGCDCNTLFTANVTTGAGACTIEKTCSAGTTAACGTNTVCEVSGNAYKCFCQANYKPSATGCVIKRCSTAGDCGTSGAQCTSNGHCACADTFTASGSTCKKNCSNDVDACDATNAACVNGVCECNVNFQGNGTNCTAISGCTKNDVSVCHSNSKCNTTNNNTCVCMNGWAVDGTVCKKSCTIANATTTCDPNASCNSNKCECVANYDVDGSTCSQRTCTGTDATNCYANSQCSSDKCICADNFVINGQACECPSSGFSLVGSSCKKTCKNNSQCGTNGTCFNGFCECEPNYAGNAATVCTRIACNGTDTTNCILNSKCSSHRCVCADNFVVNGQACECPSSGFSLIGSLCKKTCNDNEMSQCGTNGACFNGFCECEPNYTGIAPLACTQIACSGINATNCVAKSSCESDKCVCTKRSFVVDSSKLACAGCEGIFYNLSLLMASLLILLFARKTYE